MTTIVFQGDTSTVNDWPVAVYGEPEVIRSGTLIYLVSTSMVPTLYDARSLTTGPDGTGYLRVWDGGIELTRGPDYASEAELLAESPDPGYVRWYCDGPTYIRLGSEPAYDIRVSEFGYASAAWAMFDSTYLLNEAGIDCTINGRVVITARYIDDPNETYLDVLNDACAWGPQWFGFSRSGAFEADYLQAPTGDPVYTFTHANVIDVQRSLPTGMEQPLYRLIYEVGETWPSSVADGVDDEMRDVLTRSPWYQTWSYSVPATLDKHALATEQRISSKDAEFRTAFGWSLVRDRWFALFGEEREQVTVSCDLDGNTLQLDVNDVVSIQMNRMGWDTGKLFRIVATRYELSRKRAEFVLWG